MESIKSSQRLLKLGFVPEQVERLCQLRHAYAESQQKYLIAEQRRLEFARWLVATGRLTDTTPALQAPPHTTSTQITGSF